VGGTRPLALRKTQTGSVGEENTEGNISTEERDNNRTMKKIAH
jgi:hypothetical protein